VIFATGDPFDVALLVFGGLLLAGALLSGLVHRSFLSLTALFVLAGFALGDGGIEVLELDPGSGFVSGLAIVALVVILFRDGLEVEAEMLQTAWRLPLRKLVLAMPITAAIVALTAHAVTDLGWTECFLLGALLSPTDPVLSSSVVTNPRVPRLVRHSLNLESGLNDGLALPAVLAFSAALRVGEDDFTWWKFVLQDVTLGFVFGVAIGYVASRLLPRTRTIETGIPDHQKSLYALGTAFAAYGVAVALPPEGNGLIAVFVCAIVLGIRRPDLRATFEHLSADIVEIVKLGVFVVFGALLTFDGLFGDGLAAVAIVAVCLLVARPVAVFAALVGTRTPATWKAFMAWFGPKGVATMTFSLLVLADDIPGNERLFDIAALCVFTSILAHGLTDTPGSEWLARRAEQPAPERSEAPRPAGDGAPDGTRGASAAADATHPDDRAGRSGMGRRS
jgi:NhaP-type Na+/H+ or K+/H+ antiporter